MGDKTKEELANEARRLARIHRKVAERLKADTNCIYDDADDDGEGVSFMGGIDHRWASKHMRRAKKRPAVASLSARLGLPPRRLVARVRRRLASGRFRSFDGHRAPSRRLVDWHSGDRGRHARRWAGEHVRLGQERPLAA